MRFGLFTIHEQHQRVHALHICIFLWPKFENLTFGAGHFIFMSDPKLIAQQKRC